MEVVQTLKSEDSPGFLEGGRKQAHPEKHYVPLLLGNKGTPLYCVIMNPRLVDHNECLRLLALVQLAITCAPLMSYIPDKTHVLQSGSLEESACPGLDLVEGVSLMFIQAALLATQ